MSAAKPVCPVCGKKPLTLNIRGRRHYVQHGPAQSPCEGSGWLVEDTDTPAPTRRTYTPPTRAARAARALAAWTEQLQGATS